MVGFWPYGFRSNFAEPSIEFPAHLSDAGNFHLGEIVCFAGVLGESEFVQRLDSASNALMD